jgi:hypothetical protein
MHITRFLVFVFLFYYYFVHVHGIVHVGRRRGAKHGAIDGPNCSVVHKRRQYLVE